MRPRLAGILIALALPVGGCEGLRYQPAAGPEMSVVEPASAKEVAATTPVPPPVHKTAETTRRVPAVTAAKSPPPASAADEARCTGSNACAGVLKAMIADPERRWMQRPAPPAVLANGVRLFAYRALRPALSCEELAVASSEISTADATLKRGVSGLSADQITRARLLTLEVGQELTVETAQRCDRGKPDMMGAVTPGGRQNELRAVR